MLLMALTSACVVRGLLLTKSCLTYRQAAGIGPPKTRSASATMRVSLMIFRSPERISSVITGSRLLIASIWRERIAESRCLLDQARLMVLNAARMMDTVGNKAARAEIAMIKVIAPQAAEKVIDWAVQAHGAAGVSQDTFLAKAWAHNRTLRLADGPDEVHRDTIARLELKKHAAKDAA